MSSHSPAFSNTRFGREHLALNSTYINYKICCLENLHAFCLRIFWFFNLKNDIFQGTLPSIIWQLGWEGIWGIMDGYMYMYGWVPLLSTWNYHNIVNSLSNIKLRFFFLNQYKNGVFKNVWNWVLLIDIIHIKKTTFFIIITLRMRIIFFTDSYVSPP